MNASDLTLEDILRKIYAAECNVRIDSFWDAGWRIYYFTGMEYRFYAECVDASELKSVVMAMAMEKYGVQF